MDLYYFLGVGLLVAAGIVYLVSKGQKEVDEELAKHLPNKKGKANISTSIDLNDNRDSAKVNLTEDGSRVAIKTLAKWVDSDEYDEPDKVITVSNNASKMFEKMRDDKTLQNDTNVYEMPVSKLRILLVDDSLTVRTLLGKLLLKSGEYELVLKENGVEALDYLKSSLQMPDLMITDIQMPEMDGFELIDEIRDRHRFNNMPIIAISSVFDPADHLELLELEKIQGFIKKQNPFDEQDLMQQISYLMNNF